MDCPQRMSTWTDCLVRSILNFYSTFYALCSSFRLGQTLIWVSRRWWPLFLFLWHWAAIRPYLYHWWCCWLWNKLDRRCLLLHKERSQPRRCFHRFTCKHYCLQYCRSYLYFTTCSLSCILLLDCKHLERWWMPTLVSSLLFLTWRTKWKHSGRELERQFKTTQSLAHQASGLIHCRSKFFLAARIFITDPLSFLGLCVLT